MTSNTEYKNELNKALHKLEKQIKQLEDEKKLWSQAQRDLADQLQVVLVKQLEIID